MKLLISILILILIFAIAQAQSDKKLVEGYFSSFPCKVNYSIIERSIKDYDLNWRYRVYKREIVDTVNGIQYNYIILKTPIVFNDFAAYYNFPTIEDSMVNTLLIGPDGDTACFRSNNSDSLIDSTDKEIYDEICYKYSLDVSKYMTKKHYSKDPTALSASGRIVTYSVCAGTTGILLSSNSKVTRNWGFGLLAVFVIGAYNDIRGYRDYSDERKEADRYKQIVAGWDSKKISSYIESIKTKKKN